MEITERIIISQVCVLPETRVIQVLWNNIIERDGVEISRTNYRRAYMESELDLFLTDVTDGHKYAVAAGWM